MAEESLQNFTITWMLAGALMMCLVSFAIVFMYSNNPGGLGSDADTVFGSTHTDLSSKLIETSEGSDTLLNITANTNPEASQLGSRDSVATAYKAKGTATSYWESGKDLMAWVFTGTSGSLLIAVFSGIIGFLAFFYIVKYIRLGT